MIAMIIGVFVVFNGQLTAEEAVGQSIFPNIETPHPSPAAAESKTLVWSTTIDQPGAAWIKIHFSSFQLNKKDFVNLIDEQGKIIEHIRFRDVHGKHNSRFKSQKNENHTVNFWTLAADSQKVVIEVHCVANNPTTWGFKIDEIGVGSKPILYRGQGPIYNNYKDTDMDMLSSFEKDGMDSDLKPITTLGETPGKMLYKKGTIWYTCKGDMGNGSPNEFLPREDCINSQEVVDTLEVRFYFNFSSPQNGSPVFQSFYGDKFIDNHLNFGYGQVSLMTGECPDVYCPDCECWFYKCSDCGNCHCCCCGKCPCGCNS